MTKFLNKVATSAIMALSLTIFTVSASGIFEPNSGAASNIEQKRDHIKRAHFKKMAKVLSLTKEQKEAIKTIKKQARLDSKVLRANLEGFQDGVKVLMNESTFSDENFMALKGQYQETFAQLALLKAKSKFEIMQVLDEEQREKALQLKNNRKSRLFH